MEETRMSGDDLCEQPVLNWVELRALAGLAIGAAILVASNHYDALVRTVQTAAAAAGAPTEAVETERTYTPPAFTHPNTEEIPTATVMD